MCPDPGKGSLTKPKSQTREEATGRDHMGPLPQALFWGARLCPRSSQLRSLCLGSGWTPAEISQQTTERRSQECGDNRTEPWCDHYQPGDLCGPGWTGGPGLRGRTAPRMASRGATSGTARVRSDWWVSVLRTGITLGSGESILCNESGGQGQAGGGRRREQEKGEEEGREGRR